MKAEEQEARFMRLALKLAEKGISSIEPNPAVGCVIVKSGKIIGKGWHKKFGQAHAEINALEDCRRRRVKPAASTIYVTLEPCCHYGKTGPCTKAIIAAKPERAVVATIDPSEHAAGKGIEKLRRAGIKVEVGLCGEEAKRLNGPFIKFVTTGIPWVILKWAQTIDGKLAYAGNKKRWISNELSRQDVQKLRRRVQGILVGVNTVLEDNPLLTVRPSRSEKPLRIVLDSFLRTPLDRKVLKTKTAPTAIVTCRETVESQQSIAYKMARKGVELITVSTFEGRCDIKAALYELGRRGVEQLLVEGGPSVITSFLEQRLANEICVYIAPKILGSRGSADISGPMAQLSKAVKLEHISVKKLNGDIRLTGLISKG